MCDKHMVMIGKLTFDFSEKQIGCVMILCRLGKNIEKV